MRKPKVGIVAEIGIEIGSIYGARKKTAPATPPAWTHPFLTAPREAGPMSPGHTAACHRAPPEGGRAPAHSTERKPASLRSGGRRYESCSEHGNNERNEQVLHGLIRSSQERSWPLLLPAADHPEFRLPERARLCNLRSWAIAISDTPLGPASPSLSGPDGSARHNC